VALTKPMRLDKEALVGMDPVAVDGALSEIALGLGAADDEIASM